MAAKIVFLLALLILPSVTTAQIKDAFSVELKLDKTNFAFGEEVNPILVIKNISAEKDSLSQGELEDVMTANNLKIFQNSKAIGCEHIQSYFLKPHYKILEPGEAFESKLEIYSTCGKEILGRQAYYNFLDTGFYNCYTYLGKIIHSKNRIQKIKSNEIFFRIHPPDSIELKEFTELKEIFNYSQQQSKDTVYMNSIIEKLDSFTRRNINSNFSDMAFLISIRKSLSLKIYTYKELKLADYYLQNKPNGTQVSSALHYIYYDAFYKNNIVQEGFNKMEEYISLYPDTKIELEAKKIIKNKIKQEENEKLLKLKIKTKKPGK